MKIWHTAVIVLVGLVYGVPAPNLSRVSLSQPLPVISPAYAEAGTPVAVDWQTLRQLNYRTGKAPANLKAIDGVLVRIPGFIVPLEDSDTSVSEFLLVPYFGACIHVPPPPPNQIVHVRMERGKKVQFDFWQPLWIQGRLKIAKTESPYGMTSYQMTGQLTQPYEDEEPQ